MQMGRGCRDSSSSVEEPAVAEGWLSKIDLLSHLDLNDQLLRMFHDPGVQL